ncbi:MAG: efflux RND transporter periplasmic adaptor subunit [Nitrospirae bacterium]|nr:MAG: efflux RND transporter periplasmic adaptor subunit [Nitrospirota bacterium]
MHFYKKVWFWVVCGILVAGVIYATRSSGGVEVKGYEVRKKDLIISVTATSTGTIKSDRELKLTAQRIGRITKLPVEEGTAVEKGMLVAELDHEEVLQRQHAAAANVQRLKAGLDSLKLSFSSYKADLDFSVTRAQSVLTEAEARYRRFSELRNKGYIADVDLDVIRRELEVAKAQHISALASKELVRSKDEEIKAQAAALRQAEAEYALASINYDYSFIKTSITGYVTARPVKLGETVIIGSLIASVVPKDSLYIEAFIDEADVAKVSPGHPVNVTMDAYQGRTFKGEVYMISPVVLGGKQEARTFEVRVRLQEKGIIMKPGMSADVEIVIDRIKDVLVLPSQAIIEKDETRFVYVVRNGKALRTPVRTGGANWTYSEITAGIAEGDTVILNPDAPDLKAGSRVKVIKTEK